MSNLVNELWPVFVDPDNGRVLGAGQVYIGKVDLDPETLANRIDVLLVQEDGTEVTIAPASQPLRLSGGGVFAYNGSPVQVYVVGDYSIKVLSSSGVQKYYFDSSDALSSWTFPVRYTVGATNSIVDFVASFGAFVGQIFESSYYDSDLTIGSGAQWKCISITATAPDTANGINTDGYLYALISGSNYAKFEYVGAAVNVLAFGAVGDGVTDDSDVIQAALDNAQPTGRNIIFPRTSEFYNITRALIWPINVSAAGVGGMASIINTNEDAGQPESLYRSTILLGNFGLLLTELLTPYDCGTISAGYSVTLATPADSANFTVGDQVITSSDSATTFVVSSVTYTVNDYLNLNVVTAIDAVTGVITLKYPIDVEYAGFIAKPSEVDMSTAAVPFVADVPLYFCENITFDNLYIESRTRGIFPVYQAAYNVKFTNCITRGQWGIARGNTMQYCNFNSCTSYFYDGLGECAQNSIYTTFDNCKLIYEPHANFTAPVLRYQFNEASRHCSFDDNEIVLGDIAVTAGYSMVSFLRAEDCSASGNKVTSINAASHISFAVFSGQTTGVVRCNRNSFCKNLINAKSIRNWAYMNMADNTNKENVVSDNYMYADSGDFVYSIHLLNSYNNIVRGNRTNFGSVYINDTSSSGNIIENNDSPNGFINSMIDSASDTYYRQNVLRNNISSDFLLKKAALSSEITVVNAPSGATTEVFNRNIGAGMNTRDSYKFRFFLVPTGTTAVKPVTFYLRNNTTVTDLTIFSHNIPAASTQNFVIEVEIDVDSVADNIFCYTTIYDKTAGATTKYLNSIIRPTTTDDLSFVLSASPGASDSISFKRLEGKFNNVYESGTW